jgi:hypothetical protein
MKRPFILGVVAAALACSKPAIVSGPVATLASDPAPDPTPDTSVATALPPLPRMSNVAASTAGDAVNITFDAVDGARDYRVYPLPADTDVSTADGALVVRNATYRCAGNRQTPAATMDGAEQVQSGSVKTLVDGQDVGGHKRAPSEATLGYVYVRPGPGRIPVYALGDSGPDSDNACYFMRWGASRAKQYVASTPERAKLLSQRARDDGVAFYAPAARRSDTRSVLTSTDPTARYYFVDGPEASVRKGSQAAFEVLTRPAPDTKPLMRVHYQNGCGKSHDELVAGKALFERARQQGDKQPMQHLRWAGLTGPTTLVVEALDRTCPYQGAFVPSAPQKAGSGSNIKYPPLMTLEDLRKASSSGEVFLNGQGDGNSRPRPVARSFVKVAPRPAEELDWFAGFAPGEPPEKFVEIPCGADGSCWQQKSFRSPKTRIDISYVDWFSFGSILGEFWVVYADFAADTPSKVRLTPTTKGTMSADRFLHTTMEVDSFTSARRYPMILVSDQEAPLEWTMPKGNTLTLQTFPDWPNTYQLEVCDHRRWDVNDHCPHFDMYHLTKADDPTTVTGLTAGPEIGEHVGVDRATRWDLFVSTRRAYLFFDGEPWGCADLPAAGVPRGPVTVTFGDVLYHSGADVNLFGFHKQHLQVFTRRHFDNLGFKSSVPAPPWDETRFPCVSRLIK